MKIRADIAGRRAASTAHPGGIPSAPARERWQGGQIRSQLVERDGKAFRLLEGYASTVEEPYEMYDMFGPYTEVIDARAFDRTLGAGADVSFLVNHRGLTMARTTNGTLELSVDEHGLLSRSYLNPERSDVKDLTAAIDDGVITEMSFAFQIVRGQWSPDYEEYRILEVDLNRGDVSAVNYGANPNTSIAARAQAALSAVDDLPMPVLRSVVEAAQQRLAGDATRAAAAVDDVQADDVHDEEEAATPTGPDKATIEALLDAGFDDAV
ncbi:HK97 family phage prohead protease [Microbacterium xylanilyticum]